MIIAADKKGQPLDLQKLFSSLKPAPSFDEFSQLISKHTQQLMSAYFYNIMPDLDQTQKQQIKNIIGV